MGVTEVAVGLGYTCVESEGGVGVGLGVTINRVISPVTTLALSLRCPLGYLRVLLLVCVLVFVLTKTNFHDTIEPEARVNSRLSRKSQTKQALAVHGATHVHYVYYHHGYE